MPKAEPTMTDVRAELRAAKTISTDALVDEAAAVVKLMLVPDPSKDAEHEAHRGAGAQQAVQMLMRRLAARVGEPAAPPDASGFDMKEFPNSSTIAAAGYDAESRTLRVRFASGGIYLYEDVPGEIFSGLLDARSPGSFFAKRVRTAYSGRKSGEAEDAPA